MIYFVFVASVLALQDGAVIELTGQTPRVIYGQRDASDALTLTRNASEDKLVCSGEFEATDLRIAGTSTTVADLISRVTTLEEQVSSIIPTWNMTCHQKAVGTCTSLKLSEPGSCSGARNLCAADGGCTGVWSSGSGCYKMTCNEHEPAFGHCISVVMSRGILG